MQDDELVKEVYKIMNGDIRENIWITQDGVLTMKDILCVPNIDDLRRSIMEEAYCSTYAMHPSSTKMYWTIKKNYWWFGMKRDVAEYVSRCLVCQQAVVEHQKPSETLQPLPIPEWKWEHITMDFIVDLLVFKSTTMPFRWLWTDSLNQHIFWSFVVLYPWRDWPNYTSMRLSNFM